MKSLPLSAGLFLSAHHPAVALPCIAESASREAQLIFTGPKPRHDWVDTLNAKAQRGIGLRAFKGNGASPPSARLWDNRVGV